MTEAGLVPVLVVAIITRHRPKFVRDLLVQLLEAAANFDPACALIHISVSDSSDDVETQQVLQPIATANPRRISLRKASASFATAEEHLYDHIKNLDGRYVWTLSDDEILEAEAFHNLFAVLDAYAPDIVVMNPPMVSYDAAEIIHERYVSPALYSPSNKEDHISDFASIVFQTGLVHLSCTISSVLCRLDLLQGAPWLEMLRIASLYAHIKAEFIAFAKRKAVYTTRRVFKYRMNAPGTNDMQAFTQLAARCGVSRGYFWQASLTSFLAEAIERGLIDRKDLVRFYEIHWSGSRFLLLNYITDSVHHHLIGYLSGAYAPPPWPSREIRQLESISPFLPLRVRLPYLELTSAAQQVFSSYLKKDAAKVARIVERINSIHCRVQRQLYAYT